MTSLRHNGTAMQFPKFLTDYASLVLPAQDSDLSGKSALQEGFTAKCE